MLVKSLDYIIGAIKAPVSNLLNSYPNSMVGHALPSFTTMTDILLEFYCSLCSTPRRRLPKPCRRPSPSPILAGPPVTRPAKFLVLVAHKLRFYYERSDIHLHASQFAPPKSGSLTRRRRRGGGGLPSRCWHRSFERDSGRTLMLYHGLLKTSR